MDETGQRPSHGHRRRLQPSGPDRRLRLKPVRAGRRLAELAELAAYASKGTAFQAREAGSTLDLAGLSSLTQAGHWTVDAASGGIVKLDNLTS